MIYENFYNEDFFILTQLVNVRLDEGWECLGGIVNGGHIYIQTMTHKTLDKKTFMENLDSKISKIE